MYEAPHGPILDTFYITAQQRNAHVSSDCVEQQRKQCWWFMAKLSAVWTCVYQHISSPCVLIAEDVISTVRPAAQL